MDPKKKAREHLVAAEKHIKNSEFDLARNEVLKAQELDPSNVYTFAFLERIDFFKQQSSREEIVSPAASSQNDIVDNDKVEKPSETDDKEIIDEPPVPDTTETDESKETVDQEHSEDPIYLAILNSIQDYQNQLSVLADRAKELRHYTDISPVIHRADSIKDRIKTARDGLSEYQDTELYSAHEKIILDVEDELKTLDERIKSFQEPADDGTIPPSDQLSIISSLEGELADFSDTIRQRTDTYSEEDVREKLSGFERRLDELTQSMESNHLIENKFQHIQSLLDTVESKARTLSLPDVPEETSSQKNQYYEELVRRVDDLQRSISSYDEIHKSTDELRSELSQLENQLQKLHEEVRSLPQSTSEYEEIREQIKGLSTQLEGTRQPITELERQLQQLQQDVGKSTEPPEHIENSDALRPEIDTLKSEIDRINVEMRNALQATSGLDELRGQINALTAYLDTIGEPLLDLEKKVQQLSQDIPLKEPSPGDTADLSEFQSEMNRLKGEIEKISDEVRNTVQSSTELDELRQQVRALSSRLEASGKPLSDLEQRVQQLSEVIGRKADLPDGIDDLSGFHSEMLSLKNELGKISGEVRDAREEITGVDELRKQIQSLTSYLEKIGEPLLDLEERVQQLSEGIGKKADLPDGIDDLSEFQSEMNRLKGEIEKISDEVRNTVQSSTELDELRQQVRALSSRLEASGKPLSDLEQRVQQLSEVIGRKADLPDGIDDLSGFHSEMLSLKNELGKISGEVRDAREEITGVGELRKQIQSLTSYLEKIGEPLLDLEERVQQLSEDIGRKADLPDGIDDLSGFRSEMLSLKNELGKISGEVRDAKKRITEHDGLRVQISELSSRLEASGKPLSDLEQRVQQLSEDIGRKADLPDGIDDLSGFHSEMLSLKIELGKISGEVHDAKKRITEHDGLRVQISELSSRLEASGKPLSDLERRVRQLSQDTSGLFRQSENIEKLEKQIVGLQERTNQLQSLPSRIEDIIDAQQHLTGNYADLEQRLQNFILDGTNKFVRHEHVENLKNDIQSLRKQLDDIASATDKIKDFQQAHAETISLYKDLEERFVTSVKNQAEQRAIHRNDLNEHAAALEKNLSALQNESKRKQSDIEDRLSRLAENSTALKLKLDYEIESLKASGYDRVSYHKIEDRLSALEDQREKERQDYQSTLAKMAEQLNTLTRKVENDHRERQESEKRRLEIGLKYYKSAAEDAWEHGAPDADRTAELQNLADLFSIPESVEKEILREVKLRKYSQAVKKTISDKKGSKKDGPSLEQLRQLFAVSLEEYMEYEPVLLNELVSTQYHGTVMVISDDTSTREDLSERLKSTGFTVLHISRPESVPEKIDSVNPQIIICETSFRATAIKGIELLRDLRKDKKYSHMPFILFAEPYEMAAVKKELKEMHDAVLIKPVEFYDLLDTIDDRLKKVRDQLSSRNFE